MSKYVYFEEFENCLKWFLYINAQFSLCYRLGRIGKLLIFLCILITVVYFKDQNWISKTVHCISSLVVCKIAFCSELPYIPYNAGRKREEEEEEEEHRQLEGVMHFRQTQKRSQHFNWCFSRMNLHLVRSNQISRYRKLN